MEQILTTAALTSIVTLTLLEIVLGVDNIIFVSIISSKLQKNEQGKARRIGLIMAMAIRLGLLFVLGFILGLEKELFNLEDIGLPFNIGFSGKDLILLAGGIFLLYKSTSEIHQKLEGHEENVSGNKTAAKLSKAIIDIAVINLVFSIDSIITAIGMTDNIIVMAVSVILSTVAMLLFAGGVGEFVERHPTVKMLALAFLVMIGTLLIAEAFKVHVPKGYIYFSMAFSFFVEVLNIKMRKNAKPVDLHDEIK
ncbi:TerC family protein [Emticicia sp. BO119]|uniref:TerC family protein n=1 Tax=Emticicia sp. BO119 TaxID=2757768 RepID=UPI0015EFE2F5|nr:TerC family protein [Emticicia sp. BO119]MBA4851955.1 TerC family protein [Emticicia sp. BO119]